MGLDKRTEMATRPRYKQAAPLTWRVAYRGARRSRIYLQMRLRREAANWSRIRSPTTSRSN
jgi:hypothetical protein